jgi:hypothetical protein
MATRQRSLRREMLDQGRLYNKFSGIDEITKGGGLQEELQIPNPTKTVTKPSMGIKNGPKLIKNGLGGNTLISWT